MSSHDISMIQLYSESALLGEDVILYPTNISYAICNKVDNIETYIGKTSYEKNYLHDTN